MDAQPQQGQQAPPADAPPAATETTPLLPGGVNARSRPAPAPVPRYAIIALWTTAIGGAVIALLAFAVYFIYQYYHPQMYHLIGTIQSNALPTLFAGILSASWAVASLVRVRRVGLLMPPLVAAIMHTGLAWWLVYTSLESVDGLMTSDPCYVYGGPRNPEKWVQCREWAERFKVLLWAYVLAGLIFGLAHVVLFVQSCSSTFRDPSWRQGLSTWRFPTGQFSVELSVKFLRQDPPATAIRGAVSTGGESQV